MSCKVTIPCKPFKGPASKKVQGCCREAPQYDKVGKTVLKGSAPRRGAAGAVRGGETSD